MPPEATGLVQVAALTRRLRHIIEVEDLPGIQLCVASNGQLIFDEAVGQAAPDQGMTTRSLFNAYCATKPIVAGAIHAAAYRAGHGVDVRLAVSAERDVSLSDITGHRLALLRPNILEWTCSTNKRAEELLAAAVADMAAYQPDGLYSEISGWWLLSRLHESMVGRPVADVITDAYTVLPFGSEDHPAPLWSITDEDHKALAGDFGVAWHFDSTGSLPMLHARTRRCTAMTSPWLGAFCTSLALLRWYEGLRCHLGGLGDPSGGFLYAPTSIYSSSDGHTPDTYDSVLGYSSPYRGGLMVDLARHQFGPAPSAMAVGHHGGGGAMFGLADPEAGLALAASSGCFSFDPVKRSAVIAPIVSAVYDWATTA